MKLFNVSFDGHYRSKEDEEKARNAKGIPVEIEKDSKVEKDHSDEKDLILFNVHIW